MRTPLSFITLLFAAQLGACAGIELPKVLVNVPYRLVPDAMESLSQIVPANGVQIYECRAKKDRPDTYEWAFVAPEADLYDLQGRRIGSHYGGPHWEANDGSKIIGAVQERADAPAAGAIPWLLLSAKSVGTQGSFDRITSIQRVNTIGGVAPAGGCSQAALGIVVRVPYTADYYLFTHARTVARTNDQATRTLDQFPEQSRTGEQFFRTPRQAPAEH